MTPVPCQDLALLTLGTPPYGDHIGRGSVLFSWHPPLAVVHHVLVSYSRVALWSIAETISIRLFSHFRYCPVAAYRIYLTIRKEDVLLWRRSTEARATLQLIYG